MPINKRKIGNCTWNFFHYMVYSVQSQESLQSLQTLWKLLIQIYPCKECKTHILQILRQPYPCLLYTTPSPRD